MYMYNSLVHAIHVCEVVPPAPTARSIITLHPSHSLSTPNLLLDAPLLYNIFPVEESEEREGGGI